MFKIANAMGDMPKTYAGVLMEKTGELMHEAGDIARKSIKEW